MQQKMEAKEALQKGILGRYSTRDGDIIDVKEIGSPHTNPNFKVMGVTETTGRAEYYTIEGFWHVSKEEYRKDLAFLITN